MNCKISSFYRPTILVSSLMGAVFGMMALYSRFNVAFAVSPPDYSEFKLLYFDLPFFLPSILGLLYFAKASPKLGVLVAYLVFALVIVFSYFLFFFADSTLGMGLMFMFVILPITMVVLVYLLWCYLKRGKQR